MTTTHKSHNSLEQLNVVILLLNKLNDNLSQKSYKLKKKSFHILSRFFNFSFLEFN